MLCRECSDIDLMRSPSTVSFLNQLCPCCKNKSGGRLWMHCVCFCYDLGVGSQSRGGAIGAFVVSMSQI